MTKKELIESLERDLPDNVTYRIGEFKLTEPTGDAVNRIQKSIPAKVIEISAMPAGE